MDLGDLIFFLVFVGIIISNIVKQAKKAQQKEQARQAGEKTKGKPASAKKSGWKDVLGQMLEEAKRQMEAQSGGEARQPSEKAATGWEAITGQPAAPRPRPKKKPAPTPAPAGSNAPKQPIFSDEGSRDMQEWLKFRPNCMACSATMKEVTDYGTGRQTGLIYCDNCGEQHKYRIADGQLKLSRSSAGHQTLVPPEARASHVMETPPAGEKRPAAPQMKIPLSLTPDGLRSAVVWAEILGPPRALKDLEI